MGERIDEMWSAVDARLRLTRMRGGRQRLSRTAAAFTDGSGSSSTVSDAEMLAVTNQTVLPATLLSANGSGTTNSRMTRERRR